ncbi:M15 family metallopeptidase [Acrocarpospora macrocephala]|uniref:D-alanyl-D-alanine dipeptidase n=1 Tax=Acrocarpospora macrocephala TaxID=150177 RepID=A0A5M3XB21_9ACTN|nr:M15 family metallopeptidase [Acrocarpospora macrocephala]GES15278.1 D-alanyl-D-alanine dipeptidase [Acrocarpospora macrocephala]
MAQHVLLSDPRIAAMPVRECDEPLIDLRGEQVIHVDPRLADPAGAYAHVRLGVADRLTGAQTQLPRGLRLLLVEGYRPYALQERYFADWQARMRRIHPDWTRERLRAEAGKFVAPPEVAPHVAGGAVDVTLCTVDGTELPMGAEVNATPPEHGEECYTDAPGISAEARSNRQILIVAMTATGFVNYPTEWWHWSYGDRYWAFAVGAPHARYGPVAMLNGR